MINVFVLSSMLIITGVVLSGLGISSQFLMVIIGFGFLGIMRSSAVIIKDKLVEVDEHKTFSEGYREVAANYRRWKESWSQIPTISRESRTLRYKCEKDYCQEIFE